MPHLFPAVCNATSTAERQIFELFKRDAPNDWIILHSLKLDRREREIDFVVIAPLLGVFCLEVKGGEIHFDNRTGLWTSRGAHGIEEKINDPFAQAESAARALMDSVNALSAHFRSVPVSYGVMFPSVTRLPSAGVSQENFRVWHSSSSATRSNAVFDYIETLSDQTHTRYPQTNPADFTPERAMAFAQLLRADVRFERNLWDIAKLTERDLERVLSEQQRMVMNVICANQTAVVQGGAGTGKTLLAVQAARAALSEGKRVLLLCYNQLLGGYFEQAFKNHLRMDLITAGNLLPIIIRLSGISLPSGKTITSEILNNFYSSVYAQWERNAPPQYDVLIIDEGQDMVEDTDSNGGDGGVDRMLILDKLLKGGFTKGCWRFFWDPEQAIFTSSTASTASNRSDTLRQALEPYLGKGFTCLPLSQNCRNTRQIGNAAARVGALSVGDYASSAVEGMNVEYRVYRDDDEQLRLLQECLTEWKSQGAHDWHITILSWLTYKNSVVNKLQGFSIKDLASYKSVPDDLTSIGFSTVGRYKGLENHYIIITDIQDGRFRAQSLYVAMTRAKTHLCLLMSEKRRNDLEPLLKHQ